MGKKVFRVPRGCFAVPSWNGDGLVVDPRRRLEPGCLVLVHKRDDLRIRVVGTLAPGPGHPQNDVVRVRLQLGEAPRQLHEFDSETVSVLRIVHVVPASAYLPPTPAVCQPRRRAL